MVRDPRMLVFYHFRITHILLWKHSKIASRFWLAETNAVKSSSFMTRWNSSVTTVCSYISIKIIPSWFVFNFGEYIVLYFQNMCKCQLKTLGKQAVSLRNLRELSVSSHGSPSTDQSTQPWSVDSCTWIEHTSDCGSVENDWKRGWTRECRYTYGYTFMIIYVHLYINCFVI